MQEEGNETEGGGGPTKSNKTKNTTEDNQVVDTPAKELVKKGGAESTG